MLLISGWCSAQIGNATNAKDSKFCQQINQIIESADNNFKTIKGKLVKEKIITWGEKEYYTCNIKLEDSELAIISNDSTPVFKASFGTDISVTKAMQEKHKSIKQNLKNCLGTEWKFEQQTANDFLFSTSYTARKDDHSPEIKLLFYDNGTGVIVLELQVVPFKK